MIYGGTGGGLNMKQVPYQEAIHSLIARIADMGPSYDDPDNGTFCVFCMAKYGYRRSTAGYGNWDVTHSSDCDYVEAKRLDTIIKAGHQ